MTLHASLAIIISYPTSAPKLEKTKNKLKTPRKITCTFGIFFRAAYKKEKPAFGAKLCSDICAGHCFAPK